MPFPSNIYSETFSYTNVNLSAGSFTNKNGGHRWNAPWSLATSGSGVGWTVQTNGVSGLPMFLETQSNYPTVVGNRAFLQCENDTGSATARRTITTTNSGSIFVGAIAAFQYNGADRYMTIGLMNGDATEVEFGKVYGRLNYFDVRRQNVNGGGSSLMNGWGELGGTNNW